jgi:hypothetical protein
LICSGDAVRVRGLFLRVEFLAAARKFFRQRAQVLAEKEMGDAGRSERDIEHLGELIKDSTPSKAMEELSPANKMLRDLADQAAKVFDSQLVIVQRASGSKSSTSPPLSAQNRSAPHRRRRA